MSILGSADATAILDLWFGGDERSKYKTYWFSGGEGAEAQRHADETVTGLFGSLLDEVLLRLQKGDFTGTVPADRHECLALIVLLDQFSRHVFRLRGLPGDADERKSADAAALRVAEELTSRPDWDDAGLSLSQCIFSLMPYRHSASVERLEMVLRFVERREARHKWNNYMLLLDAVQQITFLRVH
jgi:uncharacterized protein (DUF924 family)